jgi:hypothetical protein
MGVNASDEPQWLPSALPFWELHSCGSCECLEPKLVGTCKKTPNWGLDFYCKDPNGIMCFYAQNQICVMNQIPNDFGMFGIV